VNTAPTGTGTGSTKWSLPNTSANCSRCHPGQVGGICLDVAEIDRGVLKADVTTAYPDERDVVVAAEGVYAPQEDSRLLIDVLEKTGLAIGRRVADLCTGSGVVAITAAAQGASAVTAFDICPRCRAMRPRQRGVRGRGRGCSPGVVGARGRVRAVRPRRLQSAVRAA
jgi:hypothetical protein